MKNYVLWFVLPVVFILVFPLRAQAQAPTRGLDLSFGGGKTGIGKGYVASSSFHLFPRGSIYPIVRCSWTGDASVSDDRSVIAAGGTEKVSGSQCGFALGAEFTLKRSRRWEFDISVENGFQKTKFRYTVRLHGQVFSGTEKRTGYYVLPAGRVRYWLTDRTNFSFTAGAVAHGDPTEGDGLGRTVFLMEYNHRFDLAKIGRLFR